MSRSSATYHLFIVLTLLLCLSFDLQAEPAKPKVQLIVGQFDVKSNTYLAGVKVTLPPGWKTYWKWSQDVGKPLSIDWAKSTNVKSLEILWPTPEQIRFQGYQIYGYEKSLVFPIKILAQDSQKPIKLNLDTNILLCDQSTCNETQNTFAYDGASSNAIDPLDDKLIQDYVAKSPVSTTLSSHGEIHAYISNENDKYYYVINVANIKDPHLQAFVIPDEKLRISDFPKVVSSGDGVTIKAPLDMDANQPPPDGNLKFTVVLSGDKLNLEYSQFTNMPDTNLEITHLAWILVCGFLGGVILNFMPCVLPILMLKTLDVLNAATEDVMNSRISYIVSAAGIMFTFLVFSIITIVLSKLGHLATWGLHFQNPIFILVMSTVMVVLACNLWGFYNITLPMENLLDADVKGNIGHFIGGVIITFLAIPCNAPFLGTAASFGLAQPSIVTIVVFLSIGLGFSLPYLLLASYPAVLRKILPRPGKWMLKLKYFIGYIMIFVAVWLLWILSGMVPLLTVLAVSAFLASIVFLLYFTSSRSEWIKNTTWVSLVVCLFFAGGVVHGEATAQKQVSDSFWTPFEPDKIQADLNSNKIVFIDFTAKWCVTCKFNEKVVLSSDEVQKALHAKNIIAMKADWTNSDPSIGSFLKNFNQYAIPCYIVFSQKYPNGKVLNTIITKSEVLTSLNR